MKFLSCSPSWKFIDKSDESVECNLFIFQPSTLCAQHGKFLGIFFLMFTFNYYRDKFNY